MMLHTKNKIFMKGFHRITTISRKHALLLLTFFALATLCLLVQTPSEFVEEEATFENDTAVIDLLLYRDSIDGTFKRSANQTKDTCQPKKNIAFSKTHKCGSSTVQNILLRYGYNRNLSFVLPADKGNGFLPNECRPFAKSMAEKAPWHSKGYNIMAVHCIWNNEAIRSIMPEDTVYISIVRNPVDLFESLYHYYDFQDWHIYNLKLEDYLKLSNSSSVYRKRWVCLGRNQMLFDFGLPENQLFNRNAVVKKIEEISRSFDFILIAEYFDESIILMRDLLCWETKDVLYFSQNMRKPEKVKKRSKAERNRILALNREDNILYQYFLKRFKEMVKAYGKEKLQKEVAALRKENEELRQFCEFDHPQRANEQRYKPYGKDVQISAVKKNSEYCAQLATAEIFFIDMVRNRQKSAEWMKDT